MSGILSGTIFLISILTNWINKELISLKSKGTSSEAPLFISLLGSFSSFLERCRGYYPGQENLFPLSGRQLDEGRYLQIKQFQAVCILSSGNRISQPGNQLTRLRNPLFQEQQWVDRKKHKFPFCLLEENSSFLKEYSYCISLKKQWLDLYSHLDYEN